ncbi:Protein of unknown function [Propionibacterium freudenreichii]|nr:Protein of unknown function [Propionibacterium freudenreichii]
MWASVVVSDLTDLPQ